MPRLKGVSFETAIIERYRRRESSVEEALIEMYLAGVSVRRVEDITEALWGSKVSPATISELNKKAYVHIEDWRNRPLQGGRYPYVYVDGIYLRRNWGGEYENVAILVAIAVNEDGYREVLGAAEGMKEDKASWVNFFQWLKSRGLDGVKLIVGDKCLGMLEAVGEVFPDAKYQRCTVHFYRNVFSVVPRSKVKVVAKMLKAIHAQESKKAAREKAKAVVAQLKEMKLKEAAKKVEDSVEETLTYFELLSMDLPSEKQGILDALQADGMITKNEAGNYNITNLGAILFAKRLADFPSLERKAIRVIKYSGNNRMTSAKEQIGGKGYANGFEGLIGYINGLLPVNEIMGAALRKDVPMYPELAVRELVANAIIHQNFFLQGTSPMVEIFDDRMEITNPGIPLIEKERFVDHPPVSRNEKLASFMRRIGVCEERGSGYDKVVFQTESYQDVYEDVSDESLQSATRGKVLECANYGAVTADRNAGGIAGSMAIEYDLDPEDDLQTEGQRSTRFTYQTKAILLSCQNYGTVQAKKSCAGGITGRMDLGTVSQCGGWGDVESESGDYVGGVAGLSLSSIRGSWAKCALSGGRYVGGIAGSGSRVTDCLALVEITEAAQQSGAIAGEITGDYQGNRFVSETLAGVDRVSLSGKAEAVSYDQLAGLDAAPENFRRLTLRFVANGRTLKEESFDYGASFPESAYPDAPEKDGCYVRWDRESLHELHFDTTVTAVYEPYVTTLSSDPQDARPALLVEGKFRLGERMEAQQSTSPVPGSGSLVETWTLTLPADGEASHTVRWRLPDSEETYTVYLKEDGAWRKTESETIGSYLRFDLPEGAQFAVAPADSRPWQLWVLAGAGCAGIAVVLLLLLRKRKAKGPKESERELQTEAH